VLPPPFQRLQRPNPRFPQNPRPHEPWNPPPCPPPPPRPPGPKAKTWGETNANKKAAAKTGAFCSFIPRYRQAALALRALPPVLWARNAARGDQNLPPAPCGIFIPKAGTRAKQASGQGRWKKGAPGRYCPMALAYLMGLAHTKIPRATPPPASVLFLVQQRLEVGVGIPPKVEGA
jgi:hypothetical protein